MLVKARLQSLKSYRLDSPDDREKGLQKIAKTVGGLETFLLRLKLMLVKDRLRSLESYRLDFIDELTERKV